MSLIIIRSRELHARVHWAAATFGRYPVDDLIRVHDIASLAMHAVGKIDLQALARIGEAVFADGGTARRSFHHFVDGCRTEVLARIPEFHGATGGADAGVVHDEVAGRVFIVLGAAAENVVELAEGQLVVVARTIEPGDVAAKVIDQLFHPLVTGLSRQAIVDAEPATA